MYGNHWEVIATSATEIVPALSRNLSSQRVRHCTLVQWSMRYAAVRGYPDQSWLLQRVGRWIIFCIFLK